MIRDIKNVYFQVCRKSFFLTVAKLFFFILFYVYEQMGNDDDGGEVKCYLEESSGFVFMWK